jgi:hypothetical protein
MTARRSALIQQQYTTAIHEAGHGASAVALGLRFKKLYIDPKQNRRTLGEINWGDVDTTWELLREKSKDPRIIALVQRRIVTNFAGIAAQCRVAAGTTDLCYDSHSDRSAADAWLQRLIAGPPNFDDPRIPFVKGISNCRREFWYPPKKLVSRKTLDAYHSRFRARAAALVARIWPQIEIVAEELIQQKVLSFDEVHRLMSRAQRRKPTRHGHRRFDLNRMWLYQKRRQVVVTPPRFRRRKFKPLNMGDLCYE